MKDVLDQPEEKRLHGLDMRLNRYHLYNPDKNELFIQELPASGKSWILVVIFFGAMAILFGYLTIHIYIKEDILIAFLFPGLLVYFSVLIIVFTILMHYSKRRSRHFTETELIETSFLGRKKIFSRDKISRIYIEATNHYTNGQYSSTTYTVNVRLNNSKTDFYKLIVLDNQGSAPKYNFLSSDSNTRCQKEAMHICEIIAAHWKIPFAV
ncbi:MAG: hypothetical protein JNJ99_11760 [Crocinitomicaceae bacterium]|nr:hypothetical protein [Crocinitomicaceae bacterium]